MTDKYNLTENKIEAFIYVRMEKGMYSLVQSGIIAHTALKKHQFPFGYEPAPIMPGLLWNNMSGIAFTLVVYNFDIKYQIK